MPARSRTPIPGLRCPRFRRKVDKTGPAGKRDGKTSRDEKAMPVPGIQGSGPTAGTDAAAIRCRDLAAMTAFYRDLVGLEVVEDDYPESTVLLRTAENFSPPARQVVLFAADEDDEPFAEPHRLTLTVPDAGALAQADAWLRANGLAPERAEHGWAGWKCLTIRDPEGNTVEFAAPVRQRTIPADEPAAPGR